MTAYTVIGFERTTRIMRVEAGSGDKRGASNSGFYVRGFGPAEAPAAFDYACTSFPKIVARQHYPLILQGDPTPRSPHAN